MSFASLLAANRGRCVFALLIGLLVAIVTPAPAAEAHPFGPPQTVEVGGDAGNVEVHWRVGGTDDLTLLGVSLGVLAADRVMLDGATFYQDADAGVLAAAPAFGDYLLEHIAVSTDGQPCPGEVTITDTFATDGVDLDYACPGDTTAASIDVTTLTDLHPAYETLATGPSGQRAVYDAEHRSHDWSLTGAPGGTAATGLGTSAALQMGGMLGVVLIVVAGLFWTGRRKRT